MEAHGRTEAESLLAHVGWMRELAQALLGDPAAADDVVQDSLIVAWRSAPRDDRPLEPWLSRVLRNLAWKRRRSVRRRDEHEARAATPGFEPSPPDTAMRIEMQRRVLEAVGELDEPLRTTVVLRYFEGRSSADIARLQGVPAGTVRWRLSRGLDELRAKLDARHDGSRAAWCALLTPFAARTDVAVSAVSASTGVFVMSAALKVALCVAAASVAGAAWWWFDSDGPAAQLASVEPRAEVAEPAAPREVLAEPTTMPTVERRESVETSAPASTPEKPVEPPAAARPMAPATIRMRFVDAQGVGWAGVEAALATRVRPEVEEVRGESGGDGRLELVWPLQVSDYANAFRVSASKAGYGGAVVLGVVKAGDTSNLGDIVLLPGARVSGVVVDERGAPLADAEVGLGLEKLDERELDFVGRHGDERMFRSLPTFRCDESGRFTIESAPEGRWRVWAHAADRRYGWTEAFDLRAGEELVGVEVVSPALRTEDTIEGVVLSPEGEPVPNAALHVYYSGSYYSGSYGETTNANGEFRVLLQRDGRHSLAARDPERNLADVVVPQVEAGARGLVLQFAPRRDVELVVESDQGEQLREVTARAETNVVMSHQSASLALRENEGRRTFTPLATPFVLEVGAEGHFSKRIELDPATLGPKVEVVLQRRPEFRGRLVAKGKPVSGVRVEVLKVFPPSKMYINGYPVDRFPTHVGATSDERGEFSIGVDPSDDFYVRVIGKEEWASPNFGPFSGGGPFEEVLEFELDLGGVVEGTVIDESGAPVGGAIVGLHCGDGRARTQRTRTDGTYRFELVAAGRWQVLLRDEELRTDSTTSVSGQPTKPLELDLVVRSGEVTRRDLVQVR